MSNNLSQIKNIVYLMLENRSLDNVLGWLYSDKGPNQYITKTGDTEPYHGLKEHTYYNQYKGDPQKHYVKKGTNHTDSPQNDPNESYSFVTNQLFNKGTKYEPKCDRKPGDKKPCPDQPDMSGFLEDFTTAEDWEFNIPIPGTKIGRGPKALQILDTYKPEELPVLNDLAKHFAVSDMWFSSVPTQTNCNRAFSICGNSMGFTDNDEGKIFKTPTFWNILSDNGHTSQFDWMVFHQTNDLFQSYSYSRSLFPNAPEEHFAPYSAFLNALENDMLPKYSYLEPSWYKGPFGNGNSYHPPGEVGPGETFVKDLYNKLINSKCWENTLFIITFDEHGGTYDHISPPWGATPPGPNTKSINPTQHNFKFDRFGVRVPTLLISPWIDSGTVFRSTSDVPYDHTSSIATILNWFGVTDKSKWKTLGNRVINAPVFDGVVNRTTPRKDKPVINTGPISEKVKPPHKLPVSDLQKLMLPGVIKVMSFDKLTDEQAHNAANKIIDKVHSLSDLHDVLNNMSEDQNANLLKTYSIYEKNDTYFVKGKVVNEVTDEPIYLAQIKAFDCDLIGPDDNLGSTFTNEKGVFVIGFNKADFGDLFLDRQPDIYFHVIIDDKLVLNTESTVLKNAESSTNPILLKVKT